MSQTTRVLGTRRLACAAVALVFLASFAAFVACTSGAADAGEPSPSESRETSSRAASPQSDIFANQSLWSQFHGASDAERRDPGFPSLFGHRDDPPDGRKWSVHVQFRGHESAKPPLWKLHLLSSFQLSLSKPEVFASVDGEGAQSVDLPIPPEGSWTLRLVSTGWLGTDAAAIESDGVTAKSFDAGLVQYGSLRVEVKTASGHNVLNARGRLINRHHALRASPWANKWVIAHDFEADEILGMPPAPFEGIARQLYGKREAVHDLWFARVMPGWEHTVHVELDGYEPWSDAVSSLSPGEVKVIKVVLVEGVSFRGTLRAQRDSPSAHVPIWAESEIVNVVPSTARNPREAQPSWDWLRDRTVTKSDGSFVVNGALSYVAVSDRAYDANGVFAQPVRLTDIEKPSGKHRIVACGVTRTRERQEVYCADWEVGTAIGPGPINVQSPQLVCHAINLDLPSYVDRRRGLQMHLRVARQGTNPPPGGEWEGRSFSITLASTENSFALWTLDRDPEFEVFAYFPGGPGRVATRLSKVASPSDLSVEWRCACSPGEYPKNSDGVSIPPAFPTFVAPSGFVEGDWVGQQFRNQDPVPGFRFAEDTVFWSHHFGYTGHLRFDATTHAEVATPLDESGEWPSARRQDKFYFPPVAHGNYIHWSSDGVSYHFESNYFLRPYDDAPPFLASKRSAATLRIRLTDSRTAEQKEAALRLANPSGANRFVDKQVAESATDGAWISWAPPGVDQRYGSFQSVRSDQNGRTVLWGLPTDQTLTLRVRSSGGNLNYPDLQFTLPARSPQQNDEWVVLDLKDGVAPPNEAAPTK